MNINISNPLDEDEIEELDDFLLERMEVEASDAIAAAGGDEGILGISELDGFLTAIVSGPNALQPKTWLPAIWGDEEPAWESPEQFGDVLELILRHQNGIAATLAESPDSFEPLFEASEVDGQIELIVDEWCVGYLRGLALDEDAWNEGGKEIEELLRPIELWGSEAGASEVEAMSKSEQARARDAIPQCARALHQYWLDRRPPPTSKWRAH
ncbi:UPF0149 family protein [Povalibacter sp.]|uniref:UPF0149 family protein n=1 Tax=Povalibacter sp. TaxID=1962978 RepID=UPI002F3EE14F